jgi:hypothetical protein
MIIKPAWISNIIQETQLLESLEWDENNLEELYKYLNIHFKGDSIVSPKLLLEEIKNNFGEECSNVLRNMFLEVSLTHGLFIHDPNVEN